ncbi:DUF4424 family protein [Rhodospirillaceae bacterium KN72]|uniref:DUF4424 family protein n=1 Tax=Pacificispira spongiicola TaxID=2729598 RepID=A0A7Y0DXT0_9PROT|nr:DUF4424 family protein [Pacificispira spongiicola]NMM43588.1 DUF4424 family protein [Pacificispira spongiicola]
MPRQISVSILCFGLLAIPCLANDSVIAIDAGGIDFARTDAIRIVSEDLFISTDRIRVRYIFENVTPEDVTLTVGFPLPPVFANDLVDRTPETATDGAYMTFETTVDEIQVQASETVEVFDLTDRNITDVFRAEGFPLKPQSPLYTRDFYESASTETETVKDRMRALGLLGNFESMKWKFRLTYTWSHRFKAGHLTEVVHSYVPLAGVFQFMSALSGAPTDAGLSTWIRDEFCPDESIWRALHSGAADHLVPVVRHVGYILTTGGNWAGPIGSFRLTVDTGHAENLIATCWPYRLKRRSETEFSFEARDFTPRHNPRIAIIESDLVAHQKTDEE